MIDFYVLGSGLSGSIIANLLNNKYSIEIIDKAKGIGGRASNKKIGQSISFDHGLQYFSSKNVLFNKYLEKFIKKKILKIWSGNHLDFTFKNNLNSKKIIGVRGNNDLNKYLLRNIKKNLSQEIINIHFKKTHWEILSKKKKFKAKNLIITFPFEQTKKLAKKYLSKNFLKQKVKMSPNITLLIKQMTKQQIPVCSIKFNNKVIAWAAHENSKKRFKSKDSYWTIQASEYYSKKIINLYKKKRNHYSKIMVREFSDILSLNYKNLKVYKIHGWKYSSNKIGLNKKCYWDKKLRVGLCGDWFVGPKAESAWHSATILYNEIKKNPPKKS